MPTATRTRSQRATLGQMGLLWLVVPLLQNCVPGAAFSADWGGEGGSSTAATGGASTTSGTSNAGGTQPTGGIGNAGGVTAMGASPATGGVHATGGTAGTGADSAIGGTGTSGSGTTATALGGTATGGLSSQPTGGNAHVTGGTGTSGSGATATALGGTATGGLSSQPTGGSAQVTGGTGAVSGGTTSSGGMACAGVAICGRAPDGVYCTQSNGASGFTNFSQWSQAYSDANGWKAVQSYWATIKFPDLDGNGRADICARSASGIVCGLSNDTGRFAYPSSWSTHFGDDGGWNVSPSYWTTIQFPDINGDGKADVCGRSGSGIECAISNGVNGFGTASLWNGDFSDALHWATTQSYWGTIQFPDINGDGKADICGRASAGILCAISNGTDGFGPVSLWSPDFSDANSWAASASYWGTVQFPDVNGDGKADVCGRSITGISCAISNGVNGFGPGSATTWTTNFSDANGWGSSQSYWGTIQFPDVNGDGLADVCGRGINGIECAVSSGSGFGSNQIWADSFSNSAGVGSDVTLWATVQFPDLDGDSKQDICGRTATGVLCGLSTGAGFTVTTWTGQFSDADGWSDPSYGLTLQTPTLNGGGCTPITKRSTLVAVPRRLAPF